MKTNLPHFWFKFYILEVFTVFCSQAALNIALRKPATQSSKASGDNALQFAASKAVDGNLNQNSYQCIHTAFQTKQTEAWWQVNLQQCSEIKDVKIYYRSNSPGTRRLNMFEMYIHDTKTDWQTGTPCYNDTDEELPPTILTVNCSGNAEYVTIHNTHYAPEDAEYGPILELCEVQVNGCIVGKYGENCENYCSSSCNNSRCDVDTGYCLEGCKPNWFGDNCTDDCNCEVEGCHRINGTCFTPGCKTGWQGNSCNIPCEGNTFGPDCNAICHCLNGTCDRFSGECDIPGCKPGFRDDNCSTVCAGNTFGLNCNTTCHCKTDGCNNVNGICSIPGCKDGWKGESCDTPCDRDTFGQACGKMCNCLNGTCEPISGICFSVGCDPGWTDETCSVPCNNNKFGNNCTSTCHCKARGCNHITGKCNVPGCQSGWKGDTCSEECESGNFGPDCLKNCYCLNGTCDPQNGLCQGQGCIQGWKGRSCNESVTRKPISDDSNTGTPGIIIGIIVALIIVGVIVAAFVYRNRRTTTEGKTNMNMTNVGTIQNDARHSSIKEPGKKTSVPNSPPIKQPLTENFYANFGDSKSATFMKVSDLKDLLQKETMSQDLENEYKGIPFGQLFSCTVGEMKKNKEKNRFRNLFPYDRSRVVLEEIPGDPDSEYINANYIDGVDEQSTYVATQGPKPNTVDDFWRMVWQIKSGKIVMLTGIVEKGKVKCHQYWPDVSTFVELDDFELTLASELDTLYYTNRQLNLKHKQSEEVRTIHQFHFTAWPDHGTPDPIQLVLFHRNYMKTASDHTGPTVVHCSAGVGRTGTFIALDALFRYGKTHHEIDIREYVNIMRSKRMNMVQTKDQYITIYEALYEALQFQDTSLSTDEFIRNTEKVEIRVQDEFKNLSENIPNYDKSLYTGAMETINQSKNRHQDILPVDKFRPYLLPHGSSSTYINAVIIPSYRDSFGFLVTQCPLSNTVTDFWRMVYEHKSSTIVALDCTTDSEKNLEWIPCNSNEMHIGRFILRQTTEPKHVYDTTETELSLIYEGDQRTVKVFDVLNWKATARTPVSKKSLLEVKELVENWKSTKGSGPITVVCMNGANGCGLFCAIYNILQKIRYEDNIDIYQTVKQLQVRRPEFFSSVEQYRFLYGVVHEYIETANVYVN